MRERESANEKQREWEDEEDEGKIGRKNNKNSCDGHVIGWPSDLTPLTDGRGENVQLLIVWCSILVELVVYGGFV
jgi:hypothetical protein